MFEQGAHLYLRLQVGDRLGHVERNLADGHGTGTQADDVVNRAVSELGRLEALVNVDTVVPIDIEMLLDVRADRRHLPSPRSGYG